MSIEENAILVLHFLSGLERGKEAMGKDIQEQTNLHHDDINDAVRSLINRGLVERSPAIAPRYYDFSCISLNTDGRLLYERILKEKGVPEFPDLLAIKANDSDPGFEVLVKSVRRSINSNEPEEGLDRLHTYLVKHMRSLCDKHSIIYDKNTPLHSLLGSYVGFLESEGSIEAEVSKRILKSAISVFDAFNKVRNNQSLAHDNKLLNRAESMLIFSHLTSVVRFIESIEEKRT